MLGVPFFSAFYRLFHSWLVPKSQAYGADQKNRASCTCWHNENQWQFSGSSILRLPKALTVFTSNFLTVPAARTYTDWWKMVKCKCSIYSGSALSYPATSQAPHSSNQKQIIWFKRNTIKDPAWQEANQLVIYNWDWGVQLRRTIKPIYLMVMAGLGTPGCRLKHATSG